MSAQADATKKNRQDALVLLDGCGLRVTAHRLEILEVMLMAAGSGEGPVSIRRFNLLLFQQGARKSIICLNRILRDFREAGLVHSEPNADGDITHALLMQPPAASGGSAIFPLHFPVRPAMPGPPDSP